MVFINPGASLETGDLRLIQKKNNQDICSLWSSLGFSQLFFGWLVRISKGQGFPCQQSGHVVLFLLLLLHQLSNRHLLLFSPCSVGKTNLKKKKKKEKEGKLIHLNGHCMLKHPMLSNLHLIAATSFQILWINVTFHYSDCVSSRCQTFSCSLAVISKKCVYDFQNYFLLICIMIDPTSSYWTTHIPTWLSMPYVL